MWVALFACIRFSFGKSSHTNTQLSIYKHVVSNLKTVTLRILKNILLFQKKIFFISYAISILIGILFGGQPKMIGLSFLLIAPFTQYFFYEIKNKNQYYYYYNLGISNVMLWISTFVIGLINLLILMAIWVNFI